MGTRGVERCVRDCQQPAPAPALAAERLDDAVFSLLHRRRPRPRACVQYSTLVMTDTCLARRQIR